MGQLPHCEPCCGRVREFADEQAELGFAPAEVAAEGVLDREIGWAETR